MRMSDILRESGDKQNRVYLCLVRVPGHSGYGKYRVHDMIPVTGGWDLNIHSWTKHGLIYYPENGREGMTLQLADGTSITGQAAFDIVNKQ